MKSEIQQPNLGPQDGLGTITQTEWTQLNKIIPYEVKLNGLKWATGDGCVLYVVETATEYLWWMFSLKTGTHLIRNKGKYNQPYACERVQAHWNGFKSNQNR